MTTPLTDEEVINTLFSRIRAINRGGIYLPEDYGARADGSTDDAPALNAAVSAAHAAGGGTVMLQPKTYRVASPVLGGSRVRLDSRGDQGGRIQSIGNVPCIAGAWQHSSIENIRLDAALGGSAAIKAHLDKTHLQHCMVEGWVGRAFDLNDGTYGDLGLLNKIYDNHIVQHEGFGIFTSYRFIDSWIEGNNVGSTEANVSIEGGPIRVLSNHLNGAPRHNIEMRGNKRITISDNICEGSGFESIIYTMPPWLNDDAPQVQITGNAISNGGKSATGQRPAIGLYGVSSTKKVSGFSIVGNIMAAEDAGSKWNYAVLAQHATNVVAAGNQWASSYATAPVGATASSSTSVTGNVDSNTVATV